MRRIVTWGLGMVAIAAAGCGIGGGYQVQTVDFGADSGTFLGPGGGPSASGFLAGPYITLYDETGIMLAAMGTAGNQYNARQDAIESAYDRGARPGDTIEYSYDAVAPAPGVLTSFTIAWAESKDLTISPPKAKSQDVKGTVDYLLFDLQANLWSPTFGDNLSGALRLGTLWAQYTVDGRTADGTRYEIDEAHIGMPLTFALLWNQTDTLSFGGEVAFDPLVGGLYYLLRDREENPWAHAKLGALGSFRVQEWLSLSAKAGWETLPLGIRYDTDRWYAEAGLAFFFK